MLKLKLKRNLKREIKRGHQWLYKEAIEVDSKVNKAQLAILKDGKDDFAWGIYDPHSPICFRVLSTGKRMLPLSMKFEKALRLRNLAFDRTVTSGYRLFNGEGDFLPGLVCDVYNNVAIIQFDGKGPEEFWRTQSVAEWVLEKVEGVKSVYFKPRRKNELELAAGERLNSFKVGFLENGVKFSSDLALGQKTGFFLDQRDNREYIKTLSKDKTVANLFSYTGGFSIYAGVGGAKHVESVDISKGAVDEAQLNWELNGLEPKKHSALAEDVFKYILESKDPKDMVIVDPPSMTSSKDSKTIALNKYIELFAQASGLVKKDGDLVLSSCSSQISFADFDMIIKESLSKGKRKGQVLRVSGQGLDHPYPHNQPELRYLKFVHLVLD